MAPRTESATPSAMKTGAKPIPPERRTASLAEEQHFGED
jgi:hypothetical protein